MRRAVMPGAESQPGVNEDRMGDIRRDCVRIMRAVHPEPPGAHRRQTGLALADPVFIRELCNEAFCGPDSSEISPGRTGMTTPIAMTSSNTVTRMKTIAAER